jgi:hypothetical protein
MSKDHQQRFGPIAVLHPRGRPHHGPYKPSRINEEMTRMTRAPLDLLAGIIAADPLFRWSSPTGYR